MRNKLAVEVSSGEGPDSISVTNALYYTFPSVYKTMNSGVFCDLNAFICDLNAFIGEEDTAEDTESLASGKIQMGVFGLTNNYYKTVY